MTFIRMVNDVLPAGSSMGKYEVCRDVSRILTHECARPRPPVVITALFANHLRCELDSAKAQITLKLKLFSRFLIFLSETFWSPKGTYKYEFLEREPCRFGLLVSSFCPVYRTNWHSRILSYAWCYLIRVGNRSLCTF